MIKTKKKEKSKRTHKNYLKIVKDIDSDNIKFKLDSEEKLDLLITGVNKFMIQRLEAYKIHECLVYFIQNMKRYRILTAVMNEYSVSANASYKELIVKKLRVYSYKTISNIIDDALDRGYFKYINGSNKIQKEKIKKFRPTCNLVSNYVNWTLQNVSNINKFLKKIK